MTTTSTKDLFGLRVVNAKGRRIGKVRRFVFHPRERRVVGLLVKRPDAALMFHRPDLFVALDGFDLVEGELVVRDDARASGNGAVKALDVSWDDCVIWVGMPVASESGEALGFVGSVEFDRETGAVGRVTIEDGAANRAILGERTIPAGMVRGFRRGAGAGTGSGPAGDSGAGSSSGSSSGSDSDSDSARDVAPGAIIVSDEALGIAREGGAAAAAGKATATVANRAKARAEVAKPVAQKAAKATEQAVDRGSYALGKQLGRASGMFAAFKEEYDKAAHGDDLE